MRVSLCVAVCCSVVQCGAVWCSVMQCDAVSCVFRSVSQGVAVCCRVLQCVAVSAQKSPILCVFCKGLGFNLFIVTSGFDYVSKVSIKMIVYSEFSIELTFEN